MRTILFIIGLTIMTFGCQQSNNAATTDPNVHKVIAIEKINTSMYTYLRVDENGTEKWLAFPLTEVKIGETYYYVNEMEMKNFVSKELGRTFPVVYFVEKVSIDPPSKEVSGDIKHRNPQPVQQGNPQALQDNQPHAGSAAITTEKIAVKIEPDKGIISIADLFANKEKYAGKKVTVNGKVAKYSPEIMDRNWIHIQDGTDYKGSFDLTITSSHEVKIGDIITCEGTVVLNKDFGAGYVYAILLEDGIVK
ncbi:MAG: hypothetical protein Q8M15_02250 [Bacteroidota bacterium]|nr:hypothetical protein [Bacteroidota bacterium]